MYMYILPLMISDGAKLAISQGQSGVATCSDMTSLGMIHNNLYLFF